MNPRDPLWHLPTRPRVANLIDELPDNLSNFAAEQQIRGYLWRLHTHGLAIHSQANGVVPVVKLTTPILKALLRAVYLDGRADQEADTADDTYYNRGRDG